MGSAYDRLPAFVFGEGAAVKFRHERNGQTLELSRPWLWTLLFGPSYFAAKGVWHHVALGALLGFATCGWSWFVYPFFASAIMRAHLLRRGWAEVRQNEQAEDDWTARIVFEGRQDAQSSLDKSTPPGTQPPAARRTSRQSAAVPVFGRRTG